MIKKRNQFVLSIKEKSKQHLHKGRYTDAQQIREENAQHRLLSGKCKLQQ